MGDDTKRNVLFLGATLMLFLTSLTGATLTGYIDWSQVWHTMATSRSAAEDTDVLWMRAQEYYEDADKDPQMHAIAKACARRILILNPRHVRARKMLIALCLKEKDFVEAEAQAREVLLLDSSDLTARLGLGAALRGQNKNKDAHYTYRMVWNNPKANGLQKDEAGRNLKALDPAFENTPPSYLSPTPFPFPLPASDNPVVR